MFEMLLGHAPVKARPTLCVQDQTMWALYLREYTEKLEPKLLPIASSRNRDLENIPRG